MSYVEKVLQPGEEIKHVSHITWIVYMPGLILIVVGICGLILFVSNQTPSILGATTGLIFLVGAASLFQAWFRRWTTEIAVTNRRIIYKRGFIRRHTIEMNMDKVESVDVDQPIMGRIFDYGTITVRGTGASIEPLRQIDAPIEFRNHVTAR